MKKDLTVFYKQGNGYLKWSDEDSAKVRIWGRAKNLVEIKRRAARMNPDRVIALRRLT